MRCSDSVLRVFTWWRGICPQSTLVYVVTSGDGRTLYGEDDLLQVAVRSGIHVKVMSLLQHFSSHDPSKGRQHMSLQATVSLSCFRKHNART